MRDPLPRPVLRPSRGFSMRMRMKMKMKGSHSTGRTRRLFVGSLIGLGIAAGIAATALFIRWQTERAWGAQTRLVLDQTARQLAGTLEGRRKAVALLGDTLGAARSIGEAERIHLARGAMGDVPDLAGIGWVDFRDWIHWWIPPPAVRPGQISSVAEQALRRTWLRDLFGFSSALFFLPEPGRPVMVVIEQPRLSGSWRHRIISVLELAPLLERWLGALPAQLVQKGQVLYRSGHWREGLPDSSVLEAPVRFEGARWVLQIQRGESGPRPWLGSLLLGGCLLGILSTGMMMWAAEHMRQLALTDELTGLPNRRYFLERWTEEVDRAKRYGRSLSCLLMDLNSFKRINDRFGHPVGDRLLKRVARELRSCMRRTDVLARYGGDEFIIALPETDRAGAEAVAAKLRALSVRYPLLEPIRLSVGSAHLRAEDSPQEVIRRADADLYASRRLVEGPSPVTALGETA